jgi:hypothetical protein
LYIRNGYKLATLIIDLPEIKGTTISRKPGKVKEERPKQQLNEK